MAQVVKDVVTWLKQWFYTEDEVDTKLATKVSTAQGSSNASKNVVTDSGGNITLEAKVTKTSQLTNDGDGTNAFVKNNDSRLSNARTPTSHNQATTTITNSETYSNLGSSLTTQKLVNDAINTKIGELSSIKAVQVVADKGTASASTMNKLYIVSENNKVNVYYTKESSGSYSWQKMDTDILDELSINWADVQNKPSSFTPASHTHGNVTNDGKIGTASGKIITTTTGGALQASSTITKSYISDFPTTMTPSSHTHTKSEISDFPSTMTPSSHTHGNITNDGKVGTTSGKPLITTTGGAVTTGAFGTSSGQFAEGNHTHNYAASSHTHDDRYYTETEIDTKLSSKADKTATVGTTITLVDKGETNEGCIIFNTIS